MTGQDGEGLRPATRKKAGRVFGKVLDGDGSEYEALYAALAAVAPDIAAQVRRECAEELRALIDQEQYEPQGTEQLGKVVDVQDIHGLRIRWSAG